MKIWKEIDTEIYNFENNLIIPNETLENVPSIIIKNFEDLGKIPKEGGCYWIWTDRIINHSFNRNKHPEKFNNGEIIYNGIAKDDIRSRIQKHLLGNVEEGFSAISIDLYLNTEVKSHKKKICSKKGNSAYFENNRIRNKELCKNLNFTDDEISFINNSNSEEYYFRNGINVTEEKHINHTYKVYYLSGFKSLSYGDIIEKRWREKFGLPRLCTYNKGR